MPKNPAWTKMTPSVVVLGMPTRMTGTPPSCPGVVTTSAGTGPAVIILLNNGRCSRRSPAGSNGDARNMPVIASRCCWVMAVLLLQVIVPGRAHRQPAGGTWRPLGGGLARVRCRVAKPAPSRRGRMRERPDRGSRDDPGPATRGSGDGVPQVPVAVGAAGGWQVAGRAGHPAG